MKKLSRLILLCSVHDLGGATMNTTSARLALAEFMKTRSTSCKHAPQGHELLCMELRIGGDTPHTYLPAGDHHPFLRELSEFLFYEFQAEAERS